MFDVITVGSATVDVFAQTDRQFVVNRRYCFPVGSKILIKHLEVHTGGAGTNTAVSLSRLGLKVAFLGRIGKGANSKRIIDVLKKENINTGFLQQEKGRTGYSVILDAKGTDRTIFVFKGSNNDLDFSSIDLSKIKTKWFYFSSMMGKSFKTQKKLALFAKKNNIKIAYNPSSYLTKKGADYIKDILERTDILILNYKEAGMLVKKKGIKSLLKGLINLGPKIVAVTQGKKGVCVFDNEYMYKAKSHKMKIVETTGAGDTFASSFLAGIIKKNDIKFAIQLGITNAESVIQYIGAKRKLLKYNEALMQMKKKPVKVKKSKII